MTSISPTAWASMGAWIGTRSKPDSPFTDQQLARMKTRAPAIEPEHWPARDVVLKQPRERTAADIRIGRPREECFDMVTVRCPLISRGGERDHIIAPGGDAIWIPNGIKRRKK